MNKIIHSLLTKFTDEFELSKLGEATQFEHFCNFAICSKLFRGSFDLSDVHTGSGNDCGIDGILLLVNGRIITDVDQVNDIADCSSYLDVDICFIQAKTSASFSSSEMWTFINGVKSFL